MVKEKEKEVYIKEDAILEDITYKSSSQSISRRIIYKLGENVVKLLIESDSYARQCYAKAYTLDKESTKWNLIYSIPYTEMFTRNGLISLNNYWNTPHKAYSEFNKDIETLSKYIYKILS